MLSIPGASSLTTLKHLKLISDGLQQVLVHARSIGGGAGEREPEAHTGEESAPSSCLAYCSGEREALAEEIEEESEGAAAKVTDSLQSSYLLRLCVHSAQHLAWEKSYVTTTIGEGLQERKFRTELSEHTEHPIWEYCFEQDIVFGERRPTVHFKIYGKRSLRMKDRLLGTASFHLSHTATDGPRKQLLKVITPQSPLQALQCKPLPQPVLHVVSQLCKVSASDFRPDLNRVAELDHTATEKETYCVVAKVFGLSLRRHETQMKVSVILKLKSPDMDVNHQLPTRSSPPALLWPRGEAYERMHEATSPRPKDILGCVEACWPGGDGLGDETGHELEPWTIRESQVMLLSHFLEVTLQEIPAMHADRQGRERVNHTERSTKLGSWREPLGDLKDAIDQLDQKLWFDAELVSKDGHNVGSLRLQLDIFTDHAHRAPPLFASHSCKATVGLPLVGSTRMLADVQFPEPRLMQAPVRRGMPPNDTSQQKVCYHCAVFADGLPNLDQCYPFVKITITGAAGTSSGQTDVKTEHQANNISWTSPVLITTKLVNRKAKVELFNNNAHTNFISSSLGLAPQGELLCQGTIYDVAPERLFWLHCYGGAHNAPKREIASSMVRGAVRPPSTYRGSVAVHFGSRWQPQNHFERLTAQREERRLVVRLYMGTNLQSYAKPGGTRRVKVLFQVAGCRLPDDRELHRLQEEQRRRLDGEEDKQAETLCCSPEAEALRDGQEESFANPGHFNHNLLSFPAEVDETGVMRFKHTTAPPTRSGLQPNCAWVERWTPREIPLLVPPGVTHAYFYVVADGEEDKPPAVFGRFRLDEGPPSDSNAPRWKRARFDVSVQDPPASYFHSNIAGFLLGSAALVAERGRDLCSQPRGQAKVPPQLSSGLVASELLPRATAGAIFPCCHDDVAMSVGSPGEEVTCQLERPECKRRVYCHIDVLAARELPSMDDDGLLDACYRIQVLDREVTETGGVPKSMSPSFMHRVVIPFELEMEGDNCVDTLVAARIPMPPVLVRLLDYDEKRLFGRVIGGGFEEVGAVVVKHKPSADGKFRLLGHGPKDLYATHQGLEYLRGRPEDQVPLDLNSIHRAVWHALDKSVSASFFPGNVEDSSWFHRPRLLLAVGYSMQREMGEHQVGLPLKSPDCFSGLIRRDGMVYKLRTQESACFEISVNLLGLRNLSPELANTELRVSSFWPGEPVRFEIGSHFLGLLDTNPTFPHDTYSWEQELEGSAKPHRAGIYKAYLRGTDARRLGISWAEQDDGGLLVTSLWPTSCCEEWNEQGTPNQRILAGDVIIEIDGDAAQLHERLAKPERDVVLTIARGEAWRAFAHKVKEIIHICQGHAATLQEDGLGGPTVFLEELKGVRIQAPIYRVPVIPYLQRDMHDEELARDSGGVVRAAMAEETTDRLVLWKSEDVGEPFVLLPAIIFQIKHRTAGTDYGTLTVGLNRLVPKDVAASKRSWTEIVLEEYSQLPRELKYWSHTTSGTEETGRILPMRALRTDDDAYTVFVDVFACDAGYLIFDSDLRIGRPLTEQRLFTISKSRTDREGEVPQFLNPGDWMAGNTTFATEPFDDRVAPTLWCGHWDGEELDEQAREQRWFTQADDLRKRCVPRKELRLNKPKGPSELLHNVLGGLAGKATQHCLIRGSSGTEVQVSKATTGDLRMALSRRGWRGTSHLVAPEVDQEKESHFAGLLHSAGSQARRSLKANLHTFLRPVGHVIHDHDRDSRLLARLRLGLPAKQVSKLMERLGEASEELESLQSAVSQEDVARYVSDADAEKIHQLRKDKGMHEDHLQNLRRAERHSVNFLLIKFKKRGTVIWAAPPSVYMWCKPGALLFVVQLADQPDVNVPVFVPSFDIRQRFETRWIPVKTLVERWQHLEKRIRQSERRGGSAREFASGDGRGTGGRRGKRRRHHVPSSAQDPGEASESSGEEPWNVDPSEPNGYSRPIPVSKHAFICRIRRGQRAMCFDRPQTRNWYLTVLEDTFLEELERSAGCAAQRTLREKETKEAFLSRFMNLAKPFAKTRLEETGAATIKGHITCRRVKDPHPGREARVGEHSSVRSRAARSQSRRLPEGAAADYRSLHELELCTSPATVQVLGRAVDNLWVQQRVFVYCCVLTGHDFELQSLGLANSLKPCLMARLGDEPAQKSEASDDQARLSIQGTVHFYSNFLFETTLPGVASLTLEVWHQGLLGTTLVGSCEVDIEDRWLALKKREFRESSHEGYLKSSISPTTVTYFSTKHCADCDGWIDPPTDPEKATGEDGPDKEVLRPVRAPGQRMPIELRELMRADKETGTERAVGALRFWVDIMPIGDHAANMLEAWTPLEFQIRITIWRITNISVFQDFGDRNDVYVKGCFKHVDHQGRETVKNEVTDVHHFANTEALFNWRWVFTAQAPARECSLKLVMMDEDRIASHEPIYDPVAYSLDHMLDMAYSNAVAGRPPLGVLRETVVFDSWDQEVQASCWRRSKSPEQKFAHLHMDVQVLPAEEGRLAPVEPGNISPPRGRLDLSGAISNPRRTLQIVIGARNCQRCHFFSVVCSVMTVLLFVAALLYFVVNIGIVAG